MRARLSYLLFRLMGRWLPSGFTAKVIRHLRLMIPTTPAGLAGMLMMVCGQTMKEIGSALVRVNEGNPDFKVSLLGEEIMVEWLCALYCLALSVLGQEDLAAEPDLFQLYEVQTLDELEGLLVEEHCVALFKQIGRETRQLYLSDNPTLRELANMRGASGWFDEIIAREEREHNWMGAFVFKVPIRIVDKLPVNPRSIWYLPSVHVFQAALFASVDCFRALRPVLVAP